MIGWWVLNRVLCMRYNYINVTTCVTQIPHTRTRTRTHTRTHTHTRTCTHAHTHTRAHTHTHTHTHTHAQVKAVGTTESLLVTSLHARRWSMPVYSSPSTQHAVSLTPYRPWATINSFSPNLSLLGRYKQGVLTFILANPGVTWVSD